MLYENGFFFDFPTSNVNCVDLMDWFIIGIYIREYNSFGEHIYNVALYCCSMFCLKRYDRIHFEETKIIRLLNRRMVKTDYIFKNLFEYFVLKNRH